MTRAAIYTRVSSQAQAGEDSTSLETQLNECRKLAGKKDLEIVAELQDIQTGTDPKRPDFRKLIAMIENGEIEAVVAWRQDRIYRGLHAVLPFYDALKVRPGFQVELVMENFDRSTITLMAGIAEHELEIKGQRTEAGWRGRMRAGKPGPGKNIKFGYRKNDESFAEIHPENAEYVREIFRRYTDGLGARELTEALAAKGCKRNFSRMCLNRIIKDETYLSGIQYQTRKAGGVEETFEIKFPPIIDEASWAAAQKRLEANRGRYRGHSLKHPALLGGLVRCEAHDYAMHILNRPKKYRCGYESKNPSKPKNPDCAKTYRIEDLDKMVWEMVRDFVNSPTRINEVVDARAAELSISIRDNVEEDIARLTKRLEELEDKATRLINFFGEGKADEERLSLQLTNIDFEKAAVQRELTLAESELMVQLEPTAIKIATKNLLSGTDWKAAKHQDFQTHLESARRLVRQSVTKVSIGPGFEFAIENGEIAKTDKVPTVHFRIELPVIEQPDPLAVKIPSLYHAPASC